MDINKDSLQGIQGLLILKINNKEYCSDIKNVAVVLKPDEETLRSYSPKEGTFFYRNENFKLLDINGILKTGRMPISQGSKIILFETFGSHFGFIADEILEIITLDSLFIENSVDFVAYTDDGFISGELRMHDRKIYFFNFEKLSRDLVDLKILKGFDLPEKVLE
jgi:chemotaxis signal transduction protein